MIPRVGGAAAARAGTVVLGADLIGAAVVDLHSPYFAIIFSIMNKLSDNMRPMITTPKAVNVFTRPKGSPLQEK